MNLDLFSEADPRLMKQVAVRFQAWLGEKGYGYAEISDGLDYPPYKLAETIAFNCLCYPWPNYYVTWKTLISREEALDVLSGKTTWLFTSLECLASEDSIICRGVKAPDGREIIIEATEGFVGYHEIDIVAAPGYEEENEWIRSPDSLDYQILKISKEPLLGRGIARYNSQGEFLSLTLDDKGHTLSNPMMPLDRIAYYYVALNGSESMELPKKKQLLFRNLRLIGKQIPGRA